MIQATVYPTGDTSKREHLEFFPGDGSFAELCELVRESAEGYDDCSFVIEVGKGRLTVNRYLQSV